MIESKTTKSGGIAIKINGEWAISIEPVGSPAEPPIGAAVEGDGKQHYTAVALLGPDDGKALRLV